MNAFPANRDLTIQVRRIGESREPNDRDRRLPGPIRKRWSPPLRYAHWSDLPPGGYPGRRSALPGAYVRSVLRRLDEPVRRRFFKTSVQLDRFDCSFSLVTRAPEDLTPLQRVPHIDVATETRVAILHYLCGPEFGRGTAFFRQDATGLEQVGPADVRKRYLEARARDLAKLSQDNQYPTASTPRLQSNNLQRGTLQQACRPTGVSRSIAGSSTIPDLLSADPAKGRSDGKFLRRLQTHRDGLSLACQ